jgi:hypothetical protein
MPETMQNPQSFIFNSSSTSSSLFSSPARRKITRKTRGTATSFYYSCYTDNNIPIPEQLLNFSSGCDCNYAVNLDMSVFV